MGMRAMLLDLPRLPDEREIGRIAALLDIADKSSEARAALLDTLAFAPSGLGSAPLAPRRLEPLLRRLKVTTSLERVSWLLQPLWVIVFSVVVGLIVGAVPASHGQGPNIEWRLAFSAPAAQVTFLFLGFLVAWIRWQRVERNRNVEDAMARKDRTNKIIFDNAGILADYVGNVFNIEAQVAAAAVGSEDRIRRDMFVFMEIDNLEFVFDKSRAGLIESEYAVRAMKIFAARSENRRFADAAQRLVVQGRYNDEFREAVTKLVFVGHRARLRDAAGMGDVPPRAVAR